MAEDKRQSVRKILKVNAMLSMAGETAISARTVDINTQGVGLMLSSPVTVGQQGQVSFIMYFDGNSYAITASGKVAHCFFGENGFKTGFLFTGMEPSSRTTISLFLR